ncbi:hypothetical protein HD806DRAFT_516348 [Xylariaceae sp. AK1471]|nr:hypothetical protein HD806DRAFT_516348 [Xylariaceae sp. AK1471]
MGNKNPPPDKRVVYLALKNVFKGQNAEVRQNKVIRRLVTEHRTQEDVADLIREHDFEDICNSARILLSDDVFASTLKAKIRFPELFDLSPTQSAEKETSEAEAARQEADAIEHAVKGTRDAVGPAGSSQGALDAANVEAQYDHLLTSTEVQTEVQTLPSFKKQDNAPSSSQVLASIPPLFPVYLPFQAEHRLLVRLQDLLELTCYDFGKRTMPEILQQRGWDCAESVELNRWVDVLGKNQVVIPDTKSLKKPLDQLFKSIANIRHTAVHRIRVNVKGIEQFLLDAEALATLLGDTGYVGKIAKLRRETQATIEELQRNKHFLRSRLGDTLRGIMVQREELQRLEDEAIAEMKREDTEYQMLAGRSISETLTTSEASFSTAIDTRKESVTGADDMDHMDAHENDVDQLEDASATPGSPLDSV